MSSIDKLLDKLKLSSVSDSDLDLDEEYPNPLHIGKKFKKAGITLWPNAEVFYVVDSDVSYSIQQYINKAVEGFSEKTPVLWTIRTNQSYYVKFTASSSGSSSYVGCQFKAGQKIEIWINAQYGTIIHEMCHALGMEHEHCREDRDNYVKCFQITYKNGDILRTAPVDINYVRSHTPPLGNYDTSSVMHYPEDDSDDLTEGPKLQVRDPNFRHTAGQREDFSTMNLEKIDTLYGSMVCTFDRFGEHYRAVKWYFNCFTCWGKISNYGCCLYCAYKCHKPHKHEIKRYRTEPGTIFVCDCGRNSHTIPMCTLLSTGSKNVKQTWYHCNDCFDNSAQGCCYTCSKRCHESHNVTTMATASSTCDCGIEFSCKFSSDMERLCTEKQCTFDRFNELYRSCVYYECYTCWGYGSNYGCCTYCANKHHKGHSLCKTSSSRFICDCGRYGHKIPMCTLLSTGPKPVKQDWYHCSDCFNNSKLGCCYACVVTCHKYHSTYKMGNASSTCDCGVTSDCKLSCQSSIDTIVTQKMCSYNRFQDHYMPMTWYECHTCWGGESNFGCCAFCANKHHRGHSLIKHEEKPSSFFCDCGKMKHKQPCCTWVATGKRYVKTTLVQMP